MGSLENQKKATFSQKAKNYLLGMSWTGDETSMATASNKAEDKEGPCKIQPKTVGEGTAATIKLEKKKTNKKTTLHLTFRSCQIFGSLKKSKNTVFYLPLLIDKPSIKLTDT